MPRKRKTTISTALNAVSDTASPISKHPIKDNPIVQLCEKLQKNESIHGKCIKELHQIYTKVSIVFLNFPSN